MATEVGSAYVELTARTAALEAGLARANASLVAYSRKADATAARSNAAMAGIGRYAKVGALAVGVGLGIAVKSAMSFEKQMSQVRAVTGASSAQMQKLSQAALATARSTQGFGYTAKQVADAQTELGKAGLTVAQIMGGGMRAALTLAKAGNLQLADAAAYTANAMAQFGLAGKDAGSVADAMAQAANATTADVGDFGAALVQTGAAARSAGLNFNATMTALTALAKSGVKGSDAGTSLKTSLLQLINPTNKQAQAAKAAGISFIDQSGKMRSLADISGQLVGRTANMTQAQRTALFATLAGTDGVRTLLALYNAGPATINAYSAQLAKQGTAAQQAGTMNDNAAGRVQAAMASLNATAIQIGQALLPPLAAVASAFANLLAVVQRIPGGVQVATGAIVALVAAFAVTKVVSFASGVGQAVGALSKLGSLAPMLAMFSNPVTAIAGAAGLAVAGLLLFGTHTNTAAAQAQWFAGASNAATSAINGTTAALNAEISAILGLNSSNATAAQSRAAATAAERAYTSAVNAGRTAGETSAQYMARLDGLRRNMVRTSAQATAAENANSQAVNSGRMNVDKMVAATSGSVQAQQKYVNELRRGLQPTAQMVMSTQQREKLALDLTAAEGKLGQLEAQRPAKIRTTIAALQQYKKDVQASSASDAEKAAATAAADRGITNLKKSLQDTGKVKVDPKVKLSTSEPEARIKELRRQMDITNGKTVTVRVNVVETKTTGKYAGGYVTGFASGGRVSGPGGRDKVPAMLTAGEVVLNSRQQALVNAGMSIDDAIRRTGGAFAKGGFVAPRRKKNEKDDAYKARVEKARQRWQDANSKVKDAARNVGSAISSVALKQYDNQTSATLAGMQSDSRARMDGIARTFQGGVTKVNGEWQRVDGLLEQEGRTTASNLKNIESKYAGFFTALDKEFAGKSAALKAQFDALSPAESALKALQDSSQQLDLASGLQDAQAKLKDAQDFGDPAAIASAEKAVRDAERNMRIAELTKTAEAERATLEQQRAAAETAQQEEYDRRKTALQTALDTETEAERVAGETRRMILEAQLAEQQATEEAALATQTAMYEADRENERVRLEARLAEVTAHFENVKNIGVAKTGAMVKRLNNLATDFLASGRRLGENFADGITDVLPKIKDVGVAISQILKDYLKTGSPTKKGPMSNLNTWWDGFVPALEDGLDKPALAANIAAATAPGSIGGGGGGGVKVINLTVNDSTFAGMSREQADRVARDIQAALDRQVRAAF